MMPNVPKAKVKARIVLTPQHAKRLLHALRDNVQKYTVQFGKIEEPESDAAAASEFQYTAGAGIMAR